MTWAFARLAVPGFHRWPDAPGRRDYLAPRHRHLFHVEARVRVRHDGRDVEFHDLLTVARRSLYRAYRREDDEYEFDDRSCEAIARALRDDIAAAFPGRDVVVSVSEDGECGAIVDDAEGP